MMEPDLSHVQTCLQSAVHARVTPGAQLSFAWRHAHETAWNCRHLVVGSLEYEQRVPVTLATRYDLASVTKAVFALALIRRATRLGWSLREPLASWWPEASSFPAGACTIESLLCHRSGLPAWVQFYRSIEPLEVLKRSTRIRVLADVLMTPLEDLPGQEKCRYSDVGYILAGRAAEVRAGVDLDTLIEQEINQPLALEEPFQFRSVRGSSQDTECAPTEICHWRNRLVQGVVHDENTFALEGRSGHAGLFGTSRSLLTVGTSSVDALLGNDRWMPPETMTAMTSPRPGGSNRLGWDGRSEGVSQAGTRSSLQTFGHLGFTGTSLWCDPGNMIVISLLTNRVHPSREKEGIRALRTNTHDAIFAALGK